MTTNLKWLRLVTLVMLLGLFAAACGGDPAVEETETEEAPETEAPTATETGTETAEATPTETEEATPTETGEATPTETGTDVGASGGGCGADDGVVTIGGLLPETGNLAFLGPPEIAAAELAVQDINEAGGVNGADVVFLPGDSGDTSTDIASQTVDRHLAACADAIVGAASSGVSFTVIDTITGAGVVHFSPANTSKDFTDYDDNGLYFRTAPSDILQGRVLGETIVNDGATNVALMALQDPYGEGLLEDTSASLEASGGTVAESLVYDPQAQTFDAEVGQMVDSGADAFVIIGFDESARIIQAFLEAGITADQLYGVDGNMSNTLPGQVDPANPAVLEGMRGTTPLPAENEEFFTRLQEFEPSLEDTLYAAETYDAVTLIALAAVAAGSDAGPAIGAELNDLTREGEACTDFASCSELLEAGEDVDYDGQSGPLEFTDAGEPSTGNYAILEFDAEGMTQTTDNVEATF